MNKINLTFAILLLLVCKPLFASRIINLNTGDAQTVMLDTSAATVFMSQPTIVDYKMIDDSKVVIFAKKEGQSTFIVYGDKGQEIHNSLVVVNRNLTLLEQQLAAYFPDEEIMLNNVGQQVVLSGTVATGRVKQKIYNFVGEMMEKESKDLLVMVSGDDQDEELDYMTRHVYSGVINNIKVISSQQINVKLTIAEVSSSFMDEIGIKYSAIAGTAGDYVNQLLHFSATDIVNIITAVDDDKVGRILAEPNLSVISGETASFLVGGELPVVTYIDNTANVMFKEYGIKLDVAAIVLDESNIRVTLIPEVSSLDTTNETINSNVPSLKTRKAKTTVELKNGQSFVLAGLLTSENSESVIKVPMLGDIPILGALFTYTKSKRTTTELIIVATVNLVSPISTESVVLPSMQKVTMLERILRVNLSDHDREQIGEITATMGFK
ncbi:type II and III secretion system protein family protein [Moritella viscosa]|uniref:type II and III secretion system protein family protein n=1 Tax=Moritella viscosa TaxID=80854 RepID=UPI00050919E0|nr:pilus assembly protein N-terminal domain-containing protein [Moritella viscosa]CED61792.1 type II/III secretion system protein [Moritella viscosa]